MKERMIITTVVAGTLLSGCTAEELPPPTPSPTSTVNEDLAYSDRPRTNFSIGDCNRDVDSWASNIDEAPNDIEPEFSRDHTIGLAEKYEGEYPVLATGAIIRSLGASVYKIVTADDKAGESITVDLKVETYSRVLDGGEGYDAVLSARMGADNRAYFRVNCLPEVDHRGDGPSVPFDEISPSFPPTPSRSNSKDEWDA